ncbi:MAG TPA: hypothetical protein LFV91_04250 [Rickettsia endosymbiont of Bembidion nr. Transversale]|nr:hypothetical protein [Rickettsia endosymbiont of Bembidion nr. Transversale]
MKEKNNTIIDIEEFDKSKDTKTSGVNSGFIKHINDGPSKGTYMFKPMIKSEEIIEEQGPKYRQDEYDEKIERSSALIEYTFGGVFQAVLKDQAPIIGLAIDKEKDEVFMTSKFLDNFVPIDVFCKDNQQKLDNGEIIIEGLKKAVITSLYCGDSDLNPGNLGIITKQENGITKNIVAKIDHGAAGITEQEQNIEVIFNKFYKKYDYAQYLPFDLTKAQEATKEIFDTIPVQKQAINEAISNLKIQNVDPKFTNLNFEDQELGDFSKYLDVRKEKLQEFSEKLALISSIEHPNPKWKESGAWTEALDNPATYAQKYVTQQAQ